MTSELKPELPVAPAVKLLLDGEKLLAYLTEQWDMGPNDRETEDPLQMKEIIQSGRFTVVPQEAESDERLKELISQANLDGITMKEQQDRIVQLEKQVKELETQLNDIL